MRGSVCEATVGPGWRGLCPQHRVLATVILPKAQKGETCLGGCHSLATCFPHTETKYLGWAVDPGPASRLLD